MTRFWSNAKWLYKRIQLLLKPKPLVRHQLETGVALKGLCLDDLQSLYSKYGVIVIRSNYGVYVAIEDNNGELARIVECLFE